MSEEIELLPCPFCGSKAIFDHRNFIFLATIRCSNKLCGIIIKGETGFRTWTNEETINAWNRRKKEV